MVPPLGMLRLVSRHAAGGSGDVRLIDRKDRSIACEGLDATWDHSAGSMSFTVPSTCLWKGNYGAVRPWYLTEGFRSGRDVDLATTRTFVARG